MNNLITISPNIQSGTPVFTNTRVPVKNLFEYLRGGNSLEEFFVDFPSVKKNQALAVLKLAKNSATLNSASADEKFN
ncbi:MAG: DUF433 domain-containing protein [Bacteroidia bacterium]